MGRACRYPRSPASRQRLRVVRVSPGGLDSFCGSSSWSEQPAPMRPTPGTRLQPAPPEVLPICLPVSSFSPYCLAGAPAGEVVVDVVVLLLDGASAAFEKNVVMVSYPVTPLQA